MKRARVTDDRTRRRTQAFEAQRGAQGHQRVDRKGEVVCIIGPSGPGKPTVMRFINGLEPRCRRHPGRRRAPRSQYGLDRIDPHESLDGVPALQPVSAARHSRTSLKVRWAQAIERGRALLAQVGLAEKADAHTPQLSRGQQQRVAIARSLAMQPKAILFDEPTPRSIRNWWAKCAREVADRPHIPRHRTIGHPATSPS